MVILGTGNTGSVLATMFSENPILFSTAKQDTKNFSRKYNVIQIADEGASKRFKVGDSIWKENEDRLRSSLSYIWNQYVILFSSLGGGSGSSSLAPISQILAEQNCSVLIVGVLPFKKEVNPPLANSVQAINNLLPIIDKISVMLFDNNMLLKQYDNNWQEINKHIVRTVDYVVNLLNVYDSGEYSPVTIDQSELISVVFGGGFVDFSDTFLEDANPKLEYGKLDKETKNVLIAMFVDDDVKREKVDEYHNILSRVISRFGTKTANARVIPGILRGNVENTNAEDSSVKDRCYFTIASGLSIDKYMKKIQKLRDAALQKAEAYATKEKGDKLIKGKENKKLDI